MTRYALGIDAGATNLRCALVNEQGEILKEIRERSKGIWNGPAYMDQLAALAQRLLDDEICRDKQIEGLGIGTCGQVNLKGELFGHNGDPAIRIDPPVPIAAALTEKLGIPVFIDRSSYEENPLGRSEWVKVYGALLDHEEEAEAFFADQAGVMDELEDFENTGKTVAFFSLNTAGTVVVRRVKDYIPRMIELAGGVNALKDVPMLQEATKSSNNMTMEEFYAAAVNADYLVYNGTIEVPIHSVEELLGKSDLFSEFKAVQEGNVWCADKYLYQATDIVGQLIRDFHHMLTDGDESQMVFIYKVE